MAPYEYIILFTSSFIGGMLFFVTGATNNKYLKLTLAFSGSYLFAISVVHLIPDLYLVGGSDAGYFILIGFFLQLILEYFSRGIEHGHVHIEKGGHAQLPVSVMVGLCIHSFLEGMPLSSHFAHDHQHTSFLFGIILHHIPVAFALTSMLYLSGVKRSVTITMLILFSLMTPAGAWFSNIIGNSASLELSEHYSKIMGIVIGIFLHISTTILFETGSDHKYNRNKILFIIIGAAIALLI